MSDKAPALVRAGKFARELNEATDDLNAALAEAERALASLGLGVSEKVVLFSGDCSSDSLWWMKYANKWQLIIEFSQYDREESEYTPLHSSSRELRLRAVEELPTLLDALIAKVESEVTEVRNAAATARLFAGDVEKRR